MDTNDASHEVLLATKIEEAEQKLEKLELAIDEIGQPAASELKRRLEALKVEERALKRNFEEARVGQLTNAAKMEKIETLLRHIEREESSVEHEAAFLHQGNPSTVVMAAEASAKLVGAISRGVKKVVGEHPFETSSVFVNHSHETLVSRYGLKKEGTQRADAES
ncbi:hypothetical protein [Haloferula sp.]|uniref:hypothetical protein n=1 Tax=Haloferula sp. TaxID=2497595 RepID=UPI003C75D251